MDLKVVSSPYGVQDKLTVGQPQAQQSLAVKKPAVQPTLKVAEPQVQQNLQVAPVQQPTLQSGVVDATGQKASPYLGTDREKTTAELGWGLKQKYPNDYNDLSDEEAGRGLKLTYPEAYADFKDITPEKNGNFFTGMVEGFAKPFLRTGVTLYNAKEALKAGVKDVAQGKGFRSALDTVEQIADKPRDIGSLKQVEPLLKVDPQSTGDKYGLKTALSGAGAFAEIASNLYQPVGVKNLAQNTFKGAIKQGVKQSVKDFAPAAFLGSLGSSVQEKDASVGSVVGSTLLGTLLGTGLGAGVGALGPTASKGVGRVREIFKPELKIKRVADEFVGEVSSLFRRAFRPSIAGRQTQNVIETANNKYATGIATMVDRAGEKLPSTVDEALALNTRVKKEVWSQVQQARQRAGQAGVEIDGDKVAQELLNFANDKRFQISSPETTRYAREVAQEIQGQRLTPEMAEDIVTDFNSRSRLWFRQGDPNKINNARVDALVANQLKNQLVDIVENISTQGYGQLRRQYGALIEVGDVIGKASARLANKSQVGFYDGLANILSSGDIAQGILTGNPVQFTRGVVTKALGKYNKWRNDPDVLTQKLFKDTYWALQKAKTKIIPPVGNVIVPKTKLLPPAKAGAPKAEVNVPIRLPSKTPEPVGVKPFSGKRTTFTVGMESADYDSLARSVPPKPESPVMLEQSKRALNDIEVNDIKNKEIELKNSYLENLNNQLSTLFEAWSPYKKTVYSNFKKVFNAWKDEPQDWDQLGKTEAGKRLQKSLENLTLDNGKYVDDIYNEFVDTYSKEKSLKKDLQIFKRGIKNNLYSGAPGGLAGFEKDDEGNIKFDSKKAVAGIALGSLVGNKKARSVVKSLADDLLKEARKYKLVEELVKRDFPNEMIDLETPTGIKNFQALIDNSESVQANLKNIDDLQESLSKRIETLKKTGSDVLKGKLGEKVTSINTAYLDRIKNDGVRIAGNSKSEKVAMLRNIYGGTIPKKLTIYRGTNLTDAPLRVGDYVTPSRSLAKGYIEGEFGDVAKYTVNSEDLILMRVNKGGIDSVEMVYLPKSQLIDIWKKANQSTPESSLLQEARKYKSAEDFVKAKTNQYHGTLAKEFKLDPNSRLFLTGDMDDASTYAGRTYNQEPEGVVVGYHAKDGKTLDLNDSATREKYVRGVLGQDKQLKKYYDQIPEGTRNDYFDTLGWVMEEHKAGRIPKADLDKYTAAQKNYKGISSKEIYANWDKIIARAKKDGYDYIKHTTEDPSAEITFPETVALNPKKTLFTKSQLTDIWNKANQTTKAVPVYKGEKDLTTKILKDLEGKTIVSKQYIQDLAGIDSKTGLVKEVLPTGIKKQEAMVFAQALKDMTSNNINVADFAKKVKAELLPLKRMSIGKTSDIMSGGTGVMHEKFSLPSEMRGNVKNYDENIYRSPVKTSAGATHFGDANPGDYFGHTRIEDMADNKTRRVIEVQSDLYQKGNLEKELMTDEVKGGTGNYADRLQNRAKEYVKLQQYNDPTAHFRMVREEIKKAAQDGKTKLQFPTGETAMKIEGLGEATNFYRGVNTNLPPIKADDLKVGMEVYERGDTQWIITDVLGDGKFKAVPKNKVFARASYLSKDLGYKELGDKVYKNTDAEQFDISGKIDTNNPIYKFYEKDMQKYLTSKFGGKRVKDAQGVEWIEVPIHKGYAKAPIEAFGLVPPLLLGLQRKEKD